MKLDQIYYLVKYGKFSYSDLLTMPTYERNYFFETMVKEFEKNKK